MDIYIKKYADSGDKKILRYVFADALDVDPTFVRYEEEYNYCKSIPGLLDDHIELTPFRQNKADWDEEYWAYLKTDLTKNFSDIRMNHMREVAKVFLAEKVQRILAERAANNSSSNESAIKTATVSTSEQIAESTSSTVNAPVKQSISNAAASVSEQITENTSSTVNAPAKQSASKAAEQTRQLEEERLNLEKEEQRKAAVREQKERALAEKRKQLRLEQEQNTSTVRGNFSKKAVGIVLAAAGVGILIFLLLK